MPSGSRRVRKWAVVCLLFVILLTGCTLPSERTAFPPPDLGGTSGAADGTPTVNAAELLEESLLAMEKSEDAQRFWFRAHIKNSLAYHAVTSMFDGVVSLPMDAVFVNGRIAAQPYQYYRNGSERFLKVNDGWYRTEDEAVPEPLDPLRGFRDWLPLIEEAVKRPDGDVYGVPTEVVEIRLSGKDWVEHSPSVLFDDLRRVLAEYGADAPPTETEKDTLSADLQPEEVLSRHPGELVRLLDDTIVKMTLWIGKADRFIYRYETWIVMPLPGGGYFDQQTNVALFRYGDLTIDDMQIPSLDKIEHWADNFRERVLERRQMEEE